MLETAYLLIDVPEMMGFKIVHYENTIECINSINEILEENK